MNRKYLAVTLIACAALLCGGAYLLISHTAKEGPELRQTVAPPAEPPAKAPDWVNNGQNPLPDYSTADAEAHNATPVPKPGPAPEPKPQVVEIREDRMVTFTFLDNMVDYFLERFTPDAGNGKPATTASAMGLNMRYGRDLEGLTVSGDDILAMRTAVLDYVFTPDTIKTLGDMYGQFFVQELADAAQNEPREYRVAGSASTRTLTPAETADMLRLDAGVLERTATALRTVATDKEVTDLAGKYLQAAKAVKRANAQLQKDLSEQRDPHEAGQRYKQAILQRESIKTAIVSRMRKSCPTCAQGDAFYLAQWAYRRTLGDTARLPVFAAAADALDALSARFLQKSVALKSE
ncbi:hypothetical protein [Pseudodesulfovibrio sp.]|uniref:hypothetical protein n=1 Tax=Pseudodesulfovibrio sp. TaxID=2035812 RepID=UPI00261B1739|nr:hypothetical protein [Pseudodesulfovibrio sp.]MDD3310691.1 hypothetical protein [Pseudodesulfovibrio sp.]